MSIAVTQQGFAVDRQLAFDKVTYPNSWHILREYKNLAERPLKTGKKKKKSKNYETKVTAIPRASADSANLISAVRSGGFVLCSNS